MSETIHDAGVMHIIHRTSRDPAKSGGPWWVTHCTCGWRGPDRRDPDMAEADVREHKHYHQQAAQPGDGR